MSWEFQPPPSNLTPFERETWRPRMRAGHMQVGDRRFYLYGEKVTRSLQQVRASRFILDDFPYPYGEMSVFVSGVSYNFWTIEGNELVVQQIDLDQEEPFWGNVDYDEAEWKRLHLAGADFSPDSEVEVRYQVWNEPGAQPSGVTGTFTFGTGQREYWLPEIPVISSPFVVTDDVVVPYQGNLTTSEFTYRVDDEPINRGTGLVTGEFDLRTELEFNVPENLIENPVFEQHGAVSGVEYADHWMLIGSGVGIGPSDYPYHGRYVAYNHSTGVIQQTVPYSGAEQLTVSARVRALTGEDVASVMSVNFVQATGTNWITTGLATIAPVTDTTTQTVSDTVFASSDTWSTVTITLGSTDLAHTGVDSSLPPGDDIELVVQLRGTGVIWDAVMVEPGLDVSDFGYLDEEKITLEYEVDPTGIYIPDLSDTYPYDISNVDANPIHDTAPQGFDAWVDTSFIDDFQLGLGDVVTGEENRDWVHYLGVAGVAESGVLNEFDVTGSYIEVHPGTIGALYTPTGGAPFVAYLDAQSTGLVDTAAADTHRDGLISAITTILTPGRFVGVFLDVGESAETGEFNDPDQWARIMGDIHTHIDDNFAAGVVFGIHNGFEMFGTGVASRHDVASVIDVLVCDGLTQDRDLEQNTEAERRHKAAQMYRAVTATKEAGNFLAAPLVLDFAQDDLDDDLIDDARHYAHENGWAHSIAEPGSGQTGVLDSVRRVYAPYGIPSLVDRTGLSIQLGRRHLPYSRLDGPGKYLHKWSFRDTDPIREEMASHFLEGKAADRIQINSDTVEYRDVDKNVHAVVTAYPTGTILDPNLHTYAFSALITDTIGNPLDGYPVHLSATSGNLIEDASTIVPGGPVGVASGTVQKYTDHSGHVYIRYQAPTGILGDVLTAEVRRYNLTGELLIDVI